MKLIIVLLLILASCEVRRDYADVSKICWERSWDIALKRASEERKPVFLYFYAIWCSWCREYEEVLEREKVRKVIEERFVPLLLDSDRDRREFLRLGGRGTPYTVVLDMYGKPVVSFHGAVREEDLLEVLGAVLRGGLEMEVQAKRTVTVRVNRETYRELLNSFLEDLKVRFDPVFGGFSSPSEGGNLFKWPTPLTYNFLLEEGLLFREALFSLKKDIEFLFDEVDGGFFNFYDRTRAFDFYFETSKSLKVNGEMVGALAVAFRRTGEDKFLRYALRTFLYMERHLLHEDTNCYLNAQISDPGYYNLPPERRRREKPPPPDTAVVVEDNARAMLGLLELYRVRKDSDVMDRINRCLDYILRNLLEGNKLFRFYDVKKEARGLPNFGRDVAFLTLILSEMGRREEALKVAGLYGDHDWVSKSVLAYALIRIGEKEKALSLLEGLKVNLSYQNPDDMVFLLRSLKILIERE